MSMYMIFEDFSTDIRYGPLPLHQRRLYPNLTEAVTAAESFTSENPHKVLYIAEIVPVYKCSRTVSDMEKEPVNADA